MAREWDGRFPHAAKAAKALKIAIPTYQAHENAFRGFTAKQARRYADFYNVALDWLLTGRGVPVKERSPVIGLIGKGGEILVPQGFTPNESDEQPAGRADCVAARIEGDSQFPLRDGWLIFWARHKGESAVPAECIGKLCVAKIKDGPLVLKEVRKGRGSKFVLLGFQPQQVQENVALEWAAKVVEIRPK